MRRPMTRFHHIDTAVAAVQPCYSCRKYGHQQATVVVFTNGEFVCSTVHTSNYDGIPCLRIAEYDPAAWIKQYAVDVAKAINVELCPSHEDEDDDVQWGYDGHLWFKSHIQTISLCLPLTKD